MTEMEALMAIQYAETEEFGEQEKRRMDFETYGEGQLSRDLSFLGNRLPRLCPL
jgi:hypothetical protein